LHGVNLPGLLERHFHQRFQLVVEHGSGGADAFVAELAE